MSFELHDSIYSNSELLELSRHISKTSEISFDALNKALEELSEKFAEASEDVMRTLVFTNETFEKIKRAGFSLDDYEVVILEDSFAELHRVLEHGVAAEQLSALKIPDPQAIDWDAGRRKGKGERKRASRQQRMQWRKR